ncbi:hypothetical protein FGO68_gene10310 [Halteria grandinella]|uniref:Uncharacterized protein n=1 Tax=Halteria grandinella TaxID=5974 RepID=A0A8J8T0J7_HALGN|nr:hypothetical protein FGO68_gene10310 [Halteria grandinella]
MEYINTLNATRSEDDGLLEHIKTFKEVNEEVKKSNEIIAAAPTINLEKLIKTLEKFEDLRPRFESLKDCINLSEEQFFISYKRHFLEMSLDQLLDLNELRHITRVMKIRANELVKVLEPASQFQIQDDSRDLGNEFHDLFKKIYLDISSQPNKDDISIVLTELGRLEFHYKIAIERCKFQAQLQQVMLAMTYLMRPGLGATLDQQPQGAQSIFQRFLPF